MSNGLNPNQYRHTVCSDLGQIVSGSDPGFLEWVYKGVGGSLC